MIQFNEIRVGNWLKWKNNQQPFDITAGLLRTVEFWAHLDIGDIEPINLTPEILEKCGFASINNKPLYRKFLLESELLFADSLLTITNGNQRFELNIKCKYLHQLQNIVFALTGEEMEIKLSP